MSLICDNLKNQCNQCAIPILVAIEYFAAIAQQDIHQVLTRYWGYRQFRPLQEDIIQSVIAKRDTLALMPTGGGKSICYQVPAMAQEGMCIVVTPLIALMKDQVANLRKREIPAVAIFSGMGPREIDIALDNCVYGKYKFLYVSPERLETEIMMERASQMNINLLAVDEAHCISQWGYDFRPSYLKIAEFRKYLGETPVLALTATATPKVVEDIQTQLQFGEPNVLQTSFERDNLSYSVLYEEGKLQKLDNILKRVQGSSIVYVRSRRKTRETAEYLQKQGHSASYYHAGLKPEDRDIRQLQWTQGKTRVMVATNAFGMGIDKPDVRTVVHLDLPDSVEAYFQEAGRAGRDGKKAYAVILYNLSDKLQMEQRIESHYPSPGDVKRVYQALANYYQLAMGSGVGQSFDFDLSDFAKKYNLEAPMTYNALKVLEQEGWLILSEGIQMPSRLIVAADKNAIYKFQVEQKRYEPFIKFILRSYAGVFDDYVPINEYKIALKLGIDKDEVVLSLRALDKLGVFNYREQKTKPQLVMLQPRVEVINLDLNQEFINQRKKEYQARVKAMLRYAAERLKCRSQMLLNYFGEEETTRCGICDVCLKRNKLDMSELEFEQLSQEIMKLLEAEGHSIQYIVSNLDQYPEAKVIKVIRWLMDLGSLHEQDNRIFVPQ